MKKIALLLVFAISLSSCSLSETPNRDFILMPVETITMPDTYTVGNISHILIKYRRPTQCHIFNGFYYDVNENVRTVAIQSVKLNQTNCPDDSESIYEVPLEFKPTTSGDYTFKFWTGVDSNGVDQYLVYDIVVQ